MDDEPEAGNDTFGRHFWLVLVWMAHLVLFVLFVLFVVFHNADHERWTTTIW